MMQLLVWAISGALLLYAGCCCGPLRDTSSIHSPPEALYARAAAEFVEATLHKPDRQCSTPSALVFAPLIVQEVIDNDPVGSAAGRFGALELDEAGRLVVDTTRPTLYGAASAAQVDADEYRQWVFHWWYPPPSRLAHQAAPRWRLVRITLDGEGFPVLWETLSEGADLVRVYASRRLEERASAEFGAPPPGRRYALERGHSEQPDVVVVRILDDGPQPMGPIVYCDAPSRAVTSVACRCMPSQVGNVRQTSWYELLPVRSLARVGGLPTRQTLFLPIPYAKLPLPARRMAEPDWLERSLRLPVGF